MDWGGSYDPVCMKTVTLEDPDLAGTYTVERQEDGRLVLEPVITSAEEIERRHGLEPRLSRSSKSSTGGCCRPTTKADPWPPTAWRRGMSRFCLEARRAAERYGVEVGKLQACAAEGRDGTHSWRLLEDVLALAGRAVRHGLPDRPAGRPAAAQLSRLRGTSSPKGGTRADRLCARPPAAARPLAVTGGDERQCLAELIAGLREFMGALRAAGERFGRPASARAR